MAPGIVRKGKKTLGERLAELANPSPDDFDPENAGPDALAQSDGGEADDDALDLHDSSRDHYVDVGRSALRGALGVDMEDVKYSGKRVSRGALYDEDDDEEDDEEEDDDDDDEDDEEEDEDAEDGGDSEEDQSMASDNDDDDDSDDDGDGSEDADQDKQARMMSELARLESDEKKMIHTLSQSAKADVEKGRHVRAQLALWESLLEIRIRIQKIVDLANRLPQPDVYASVLEAAAEFQASPSSAIGAEVLQTASSELVALLNDLVSIRLELVARNPLSKIAGSDAISRKRKHSLVDVIAEDDGEPTDKHARLAAAFDDVIAPLDAGFVAFRDETIDKWNSKVQVASGIPLQKKFKVINQSIVSQIHQILQDRERLVKRTQLSRSDYPIIGKPVAARPSEQELAEQAAEQQASGISDEQRDKHLSNYDVEIFDDSDYYQQLLKELIESRMAETDDPIMLGMKFAQLKQMNKRNKKKVDTKASKGRKVRYHVHEKLQNFMASEPRGYWHEEMISELFASLFGRQSKGSAQADAQDTAGDAPTVQITATDGFKILG